MKRSNTSSDAGYRESGWPPDRTYYIAIFTCLVEFVCFQLVPCNHALNNWDHLDNVQSGLWWISRSITAGDRVMCEGHAAGT